MASFSTSGQSWSSDPVPGLDSSSTEPFSQSSTEPFSQSNYGIQAFAGLQAQYRKLMEQNMTLIAQLEAHLQQETENASGTLLDMQQHGQVLEAAESHDFCHETYRYPMASGHENRADARAKEHAGANLKVFDQMCVCVFITAGPITKLFAWGEGDSGGHVLRETTS